MSRKAEISCIPYCIFTKLGNQFFRRLFKSKLVSRNIAFRETLEKKVLFREHSLPRGRTWRAGAGCGSRRRWTRTACTGTWTLRAGRKGRYSKLSTASMVNKKCRLIKRKFYIVGKGRYWESKLRAQQVNKKCLSSKWKFNIVPVP